MFRKIDVKLEYRPSIGNAPYRYVGGVVDFDGCEYVRKVTAITPFMRVFNFLKNATNGFLHECPYEQGHYEFLNYTTSIGNYPFMNKGDYKLYIFARDPELDPEGGKFTIWFSLLVRGGDLF